MNTNDKNITTAKMLYDERLEKDIVAFLSRDSFQQIQEVRELIKPDYFYFEKTRYLYSVICSINDKGEECDWTKMMPIISKELKISVKDFVEIVGRDTYLSYIELLHHIPILIDYAKRRDIWIIGKELIKAGITENGELDEVVTNTIVKLKNVILDLTNSSEYITMHKVLEQLQN